MSDYLKRICDALEYIAENSKKVNTDEKVALIHEVYAEHIKVILETDKDIFEKLKSFRALEILARQSAIQLRDQ